MTVTSRDAELARLLDERAIRTVLYRYCRAIDRMDEELLRSCYHPDAVDDHGSFRGGVDEYVTWVWRLLARYRSTMHFLGNILVEFGRAEDGAAEDGVAQAESYGIAFHRSDDPDPRRNLVTGFRYIDRFERRGTGGWRIAMRRCTTEWVQVDSPDRQWPIPDGMLQGARDRSDPVYDWH